MLSAVSVDEVSAAAISLSKDSVSVQVGKTASLKLMSGNEEINAEKVSWSSKNKSIAQVSSKGVVRGKKAGSTKIVAKYNGKSYTCSVKVKSRYIKFGHYEQDNDASNGKEAIEWEVLGYEDGELLLISRYILDAVPYNYEWTDVTWETCALRKWLNDDFLQYNLQ